VPRRPAKDKRRSPRLPGRLFAEPESAPEHVPDAHIANVDGAARGNPGPASYGVVVRAPDGRASESLAKYIGRTTNNVAEYYGLIAALDYAHAHHIKKLRVRSDSELLVRQMQGRYKVKSADLKPLHERARKLAASLVHFAIEHVPRGQNAEADALANAALDRTGGRGVAPTFRRADAGASGAGLQAAAASEPRRIRARFHDGKLIPAEPLDLPDGAEVEITVQGSAETYKHRN
jgi:ribonuclease HI